MITSRELMNIGESRGTPFTYKALRGAMRRSGVRFKQRRVNDMSVRAYLTSDDVVLLGTELEVDFNYKQG